jgi:hypothetical protein
MNTTHKKRFTVHLEEVPGFHAPAYSDVTAYRHALVEFDAGLSPAEQFNLYAKSNLPCAAIIYSGGKPSKVEEIATRNLYSFCAQCTAEGEGKNEIAKRLRSWLLIQDSPIDASIPTCKRTIERLVQNKKLSVNKEDKYVKGANT